MATILMLAACGKTAALPNVEDPEPDASSNEPAPPDTDAASTPVDAASRPVSLDDYQRTCETNADCILVNPPPCPDRQCWCRTAAINQADYLDYSNALLAEIQAQSCKSLPHGLCEGACDESLVAICSDGVCEPVPHPPFQDADAYDQSCTTADDCVGVNPDPCRCVAACPGGIIARSALAEFEADQAALPACGERGKCPGPDVCGGGEIDCQEGHCIFRQYPVPP